MKSTITLALAAFALSGCATTRYVTVHCVTPEQVETLRKAEPERVGGKLTGNAQDDLKIIAGSNVELRQYGRSLVGVIEGCSSK